MLRILVGCSCLATFPASAQDTPAFTYPLPTAEDRIAALGMLEGLPATERRFFEISEPFQPKFTPGPHDWLATHPEPTQSYARFIQSGRKSFREPRVVIYLQPIGAMPEPFAKLLPTVRKYAEIYFQKPVVVGPDRRSGGDRLKNQSLDLGKAMVDHRHPRTALPGNAQRRLLPGRTDVDGSLPRPGLEFCLRTSPTRSGVGIYSFARYGSPDNRADFLRRCLRVLTHETGHLFGMGHCVYFQCLMNGTNHQAESDATPLFLCPICLRKLHGTQHVDLARRHFELAEFFSKNDLSPESGWMTMRAKALGLGSSETR